MVTQPASADEEVAGRQARNGGSWFNWIAGVTLVNVITASLGFSRPFLLSLLMPLIVADAAHKDHTLGIGTTAIVSAFGVGMFLVFGQAAKKGARWAFITGMIFYGIDTLFWIGAQEGRALGLALHVLALWRIGSGLGAANRLAALRRQSAPQAAVPAWSPPDEEGVDEEDEDNQDDDEDAQTSSPLDRNQERPEEAQTLSAQIQAQFNEMQAQETARPNRTHETTRQTQTPVAFSEISVPDTHIGVPDTKIGVPSTQIDTLDDHIDDQIGTPDV